jgi:hypothetical protein
MALTLDVYDDALALAARASKVFQPRTPITTKDLFAGRWGELTKVSDAVNQPGLHVVIYGERGVGKTSLANVVRPTIRALDQFGKPKGEIPERLVIKSIGTTGDTFSTIWDKLLSEITWPIEEDAIGLTNAVKQRFATTREAFTLKGDITVDNVRRVLAVLPGSVFIIDEFDRTADGTSKQFTDLDLTDLLYQVDC